MSRETARDKADRILTEGRLRVTDVGPTRATARVRGEGHEWTARYRDHRWTCSCPARTDQCSHLHALRRVIVVDPGEDR
jgi:hypothetical protein